MRASRLVAIVLLLQNRGRMTAPQLAEELEVWVRTIYRDLDALADHRSADSTDWDGVDEDGWRRLSLTFERPSEARTALLGLGDLVEVLGPAGLGRAWPSRPARGRRSTARPDRLTGPGTGRRGGTRPAPR